LVPVVTATMADLPPHLADVRNKVTLGVEVVENVSSTAYPGCYPGIDDAFDIEKFKEAFDVRIISETPDEIEFDMLGVDAAIANTVRRILLAEVPTMAAESCLFYNNTSIIQDEVLAHRIGLIPIKADPRLFDYSLGSNDTDENTRIVFQLNVKCEMRKGVPKGAHKPEDLYTHYRVTSQDLVWVPQGNQATEHAEDPIRPVHSDILIALLKPGQEINMEIHCIKGIGKEHAKWSPVGTASYRLMPEIVLKKDFVGEEADDLAACFNPGVIIVEQGGDGVRRARVGDARACTMTREVYRHAHLAPYVELKRIRDHFIFSVESTGAMPAATLVTEAIGMMLDKVELLTLALDQLERDDGDEMEEDAEAEDEA